MMKNKGLIVFLIVLLSVAIIGLSIFTFKVIKNDLSFSVSFGKIFNNAYKELVIDEEFDSDFANYKFNVTAGDVYIKESSSDKIMLKIYGDKEFTSFNDNDDTLEISLTDNACKGFCVFNKISKVELYVPKSSVSNYVFDCRYGDINVIDLANANVEIKNNAGDIDIIGINEAKIVTDTGDIKIDNVVNANINSKVGDIKIGSVDTLFIETNTGDIKIDSVNKSLDIKHDVGDIKIGSVNIEKDSKITNRIGDIKITNTNDIYVDAKTNIGDVKVTNKNRKAEVVLTITGTTGDIKVNN